MGGEAAALFMYFLEMKRHIKMLYFVTTGVSTLPVSVTRQYIEHIEDLKGLCCLFILVRDKNVFTNLKRQHTLHYLPPVASSAAESFGIICQGCEICASNPMQCR